MLAVISVNDVYVDESSSTAEVSVSYTGTLNSGSVDWATSNGTAIAGADYTTASGTLSISAFEPVGPPSPGGGGGGENTLESTLSIPLSEDLLGESGETFYVTLSNASGNTIGDATAIVVILDNDSLGQTRAIDSFISSSEQSSHGGGVTASQALSNNITLEYSTLTYGSTVLDIRTEQPIDSVVPSELKADLFVNGTLHQTVYYDTTGMSLGDEQRFAFEFNDPSLVSGTYPWQLVLTETIGTHESYRIMDGVLDLHDRSESVFGNGWQLAGLDRLAINNDWATVLLSNGSTARFARNSDGEVEPIPGPPSPTGDETYVPLLGGFQEYSDGTFLWVQRDKTELWFDADGNLISRTDRNNNLTQYTYDTSSNLTQITFQDGRTVSFSYGLSGYVDSITEWAGQTTDLSHDFDGNLETIQTDDPDGAGPDLPAETNFDYWAGNGLLKQHINALDEITSFSYDSFDRVSSITEPGCAITLFSPQIVQGLVAAGSGTQGTPAPLPHADPSGTTTNSLSHSIESKYGPNGGLLAVTDALGNTTTWERGASGFATQMVSADPDGPGPLVAQVSNYEYDSQFNLTKTIYPDLTEALTQYDTTWNVPIQTTDALGNITLYDLDSRGNVISSQKVIGLVDDPYNAETDDIVTSMTYTSPPTGSGQVQGGKLLSYADPLGKVTKYVFGATVGAANFGQVIETIEGFGTALASITSVTYGSNHLPSSVTDPLGNLTSYSYDQIGRLTTTTYPDPDGAGPLSSPTTSSVYDALNRVVSSIDAIGNATSYTFDGRGNLTSVTLPDPDGTGPRLSPVTSYTYDLLNRRISETDASGNSTTITYDAADRRTSTTLPDPDGAGPLTSPVHSSTYDNLGRLASETDPLGNVTTYAYDSMNRTTSVTLPDPDSAGPLSAPVYLTDYDDNGRILSETDPLGNTTTYLRDELGRIVATTLPDPDGAGAVTPRVASVVYDDSGNITSETSFDGLSQAHTYDDLHRRTSTTLSDPDGAGPIAAPVHSWTFDLNGNLLSETDASGGSTDFEYDNLGRLTKTIYPDPDGVGPLASPESLRAYDAASRLIASTDSLGQTTDMAYDNLGLLLTETQPDPDGAGPLTRPTTTYSYDAIGRRTSLTDPLGGITSWEFDNVGRLTTETDPLLNSTTYIYDASNQNVSITDRNGNEREFTYDNLGRKLGEVWKDSGVVTHSMAFSYDANGNTLSAADSFADYTYTYDDANRPTSVTTDFGSGNGQFKLAKQYYGNGMLASVDLQFNTGAGWTADLIDTYSYDALNRKVSIVQTGQTGGATVSDKLIELGYDAASRINPLNAIHLQLHHLLRPSRRLIWFLI